MRYEYYCIECGHKYEVDCSVEDRDNEVGSKCYMCGTEHSCKRSVGNAGFILKGNCWASDGYARVLGDATNYKE